MARRSTTPYNGELQQLHARRRQGPRPTRSSSSWRPSASTTAGPRSGSSTATTTMPMRTAAMATTTALSATRARRTCPPSSWSTPSSTTGATPANFLNSPEKLRRLGVADAAGIANYFGLLQGRGLRRHDVQPLQPQQRRALLHRELRRAGQPDRGGLELRGRGLDGPDELEHPGLPHSTTPTPGTTTTPRATTSATAWSRPAGATRASAGTPTTRSPSPSTVSTTPTRGPARTTTPRVPTSATA